MYKVNNKDIKTTPGINFVNFEQVNVDWACLIWSTSLLWRFLKAQILQKKLLKTEAVHNCEIPAVTASS